MHHNVPTAQSYYILIIRCSTEPISRLANGKLHYNVGENDLYLITLGRDEMPFYRLQEITLLLTLLFWM